MARVISLYRYPVKGFRGETLDQVALRRGEGVPGDRVIGITRGIATAGTAPFHQLTTNADLVHYRPERRADTLGLTEAKSGDAINLFNDLPRLRQAFGEQARVIHREDRLGHWDFDDSMLSIINVATVAALSDRLGVPVDPMRFRGNIYIEAEPFIEFSWLGQGVQLGGACLSIIRPIKRCSATSVNPQTGERDINTPAQLNRLFGHIYCGVYAHVEAGGQVRPFDSVRVSGHDYPRRLAIAVSVPKAPPVANWPRPALVVKVTEEAMGIRSLWLRDPMAHLGALDAIKPGQHIAVHGLTKAGDWRRYTISGHKGDRLRITVKRDTGVGSRALHEQVAGELIQITGPFGPETVDTCSPAIFILSAGIGITPTISKLQALVDAGYDKPVRVIHTIRGRRELALWDEVKQLAALLPYCVPALHITGQGEPAGDALLGRPDLAALMLEAARLSADIHLCGPETFQSSVLAMATEAGIAARLHMDSFVTPDSAVEMRPIPDSGPFAVTFKRSGITAQWQPQEGPLLQFAEAKGLVMAAHCRAGLCQTCECRVLEGEVLSLSEAGRARREHALLCCMVPASDVVLDC
ncbi:MOSC domain-containing protein [Pseudomonas sp. NPDC089752]|uniref:MOSC domain-containing protein n=1 Tax=Pseudomonas sp. NPDC089752 TaxID=3364472 RepID=UPI00382EDEFA